MCAVFEATWKLQHPNTNYTMQLLKTLTLQHTWLFIFTGHIISHVITAGDGAIGRVWHIFSKGQMMVSPATNCPTSSYPSS